MNDLYDEMIYDDDDVVTFEKFRPKPKQVKTDKRSKKDLIQEKRREKSRDREEIANQEIKMIV